MARGSLAGLPPAVRQAHETGGSTLAFDGHRRLLPEDPGAECLDGVGVGPPAGYPGDEFVDAVATVAASGEPGGRLVKGVGQGAGQLLGGMIGSVVGHGVLLGTTGSGPPR